MLNKLLENETAVRLITTAVIIVIAVILHFLVRKLTESKLVRSIGNANSHAKTYIHVIQGICNTAIIIFAVYFILLAFGYDVQGMIAGIGVVSIVVGFALQDLLKDIIAALGLIADGAFDVGSQIGINEYSGEVVEFNLRKTTIYDFNLACTVTLNNRDIKEIRALSEYFNYNLPVPNELTPVEVNMLTSEILALAKNVQGVTDAENLGIQYFTDTTIVYKLRLYCNLRDRLPITRAVNGLVYNYYAERDINVVQKDVKLYKE